MCSYTAESLHCNAQCSPRISNIIKREKMLSRQLIQPFPSAQQGFKCLLRLKVNAYFCPQLKGTFPPVSCSQRHLYILSASYSYTVDIVRIWNCRPHTHSLCSRFIMPSHFISSHTLPIIFKLFVEIKEICNPAKEG